MERKISNYQLVEEIGHGAMGLVYKAEDTILGGPVAIKVIQPTQGSDREAVQRFLNEARAISKIDHHNVVRLHHVVQEAGDYYMVMQYVEGRSLSDVMSEGRLPVKRALEIACDAATGLEEAHAHGIVHRDLKPANIMITTDGKTKLLDFGVAHFVDFTSITDEGVFVGTLSYAAPEQLSRKHAVDARVDVYGLGSVLYEMLTGHLPFEPEDRRALIYQILNQDAPPITTFRGDFPKGLERVVSRALSKDPADRYADITEMLHDLQIIRRRLGNGAGGEDDSLIARWRPSRRTKRMITVSVAVVLVAIGTFVVFQVFAPRRAAPRIMVARWQNASALPELEWVTGALMSGLIRTLGDLKAHNVMSRETVTATTGALEASSAGTWTQYDAARRVGASYLVSGAMNQAGPWLQLDCELTDISHEGVLVDSWTIEVRDSTRIHEAVVELAMEIASALHAGWNQDPRESETGQITTSATALRLYELALSAEERRENAEALAHLFEAVAIDSTFAEAHFLISRLTRDRDVEQKHYTLAMKYRLRAPPIVRKLIEAVGLLWDEEYDQSIALFEEIIAEDPEQVTARKELALALQWKGRFRDAANEYVVLHSISPLDFSFYNFWASACVELGKPDDGLDLIMEWRNHFPHDDQPVMELIFFCQRTGRYLEGVTVCDSIAAVDVDSQPFPCGWLLQGIGRLDDAERVYRNLMETPDVNAPSSRGLSYMALLCYRREEYAKGLDYIERAIALQDGVWNRWLAGQLAASGGNFERAHQHANWIAESIGPSLAETTVTETYGSRRWYFQLLGWIELKQGRPEEAIRLFRRSLQYTTRVDGPLFRTYLARAELAAGRLDDAVTNLETVLETTNDPEAQMYLGEAHLRRGEPAQALDVLTSLDEMLSRADPDDPLTIEVNRLIAAAEAQR